MPLERLILAALVAPALLAAAPPGGLHVSATVSPAPSGARVASGRLSVEGAAPGGDRLTAVSSPDFDKVEVHSMDMTGGVMRMRPAPLPMAVPAGGKLEIDPTSGRHLMLIGPHRAFKAGDAVRLRLTFAKAGPRTVDAPVEPPR